MQVLLEASLAEQVAQDLQSLEGIPAAGALAELNFRLLTEHRTLEEIRLQGVLSCMRIDMLSSHSDMLQGLPCQLFLCESAPSMRLQPAPCMSGRRVLPSMRAVPLSAVSSHDQRWIRNAH